MTGLFVAWSHKRKDSPGWIEDGTGCHIWTGSRSGSGHPTVRCGNRMEYVHRVRYEREIGPIPEGLELDHYVCSRGHDGCCNPHHCRPVTLWENNLRGNGVAARNLAKTHCPKGHALVEGNLDPYYVERGWRKCLTCKRATAMKAYFKRAGQPARFADWIKDRAA